MAMSRFEGCSSLMDLPAIRISPLVAASNPAIMFSSVDLPQPDGPIKTRNPPFFYINTDVLQSVNACELLAQRIDLEEMFCRVIHYFLNHFRSTLDGTSHQATHEIST